MASIPLLTHISVQMHVNAHVTVICSGNTYIGFLYDPFSWDKNYFRFRKRRQSNMS